MKNLKKIYSLSLALLATVIIGSALTGCATTGSSSVNSDIEAALPAVTAVSATATSVLLQVEVQQASTRARIEGELNSVSVLIKGFTSGTLPTVAQFQAAILACGGTPTDANFAIFASSLSALYSTYYPDLVSGNANAQTIADLLNAVATGIDEATTATNTASLHKGK